MEDATDNLLRDMWDRLVLLLITQPREGWEPEFEEITCRSAPDFPDLVLVRPPRLLFIKLKTATGRLRSEQCGWLDALAGCSFAPGVHLWRPSSWNEIEATLARRIPLASSFIRNLNMGA